MRDHIFNKQHFYEGSKMWVFNFRHVLGMGRDNKC